MSIREKVYFRRFSQLFGHSSKNYLKLFEAFQQLDHYEPEKIKVHFKGSSIINNWSSEVAYLQKQLLKSMVNFHAERSLQSKLLKSILEINLLIEKGFTKQANKILLKTKKLAYQSEDFSTIFKLIQLEEEILFKEGVLHFTDHLEALQKERQFVSNKISRLNQLRYMREDVRELQFYIKEKEYVDRLDSYVKHNLLTSSTYANSIRAMEHWLYVKSVVTYLNSNYEAAARYNAEMITLLEAHPRIFKPAKILVAISNYLYDAALLKDEPKFIQMMRKLKAYQANPALNQVYLAYVEITRTLEIGYRINKQKALKDTLEKASPYMDQFYMKLEVAQLDYLANTLARSCLLTQQYELGIHYLKNTTKKDVVDSSLPHFKFFLMIFYLELGKLELLQSEADAAYKLFKRKKLYNDFSGPILRFFKNIARYPDRSEIYYEQLRSSLKTIRNSRIWNVDFLIFDYLQWVEEKLD